MKNFSERREYRGVAYDVSISHGEDEVTVEVVDPFGNHNHWATCPYIRNGEQRAIPDEDRDDFAQAVSDEVERRFKETVDDWLAQDPSLF